MSKFHYDGQELDVFAKAIHWKRYFKSILIPYIGQRVAEVGAGIGATTAVLCDGRQEVWLCIEPDETLRRQIDKRITACQLPACCQTSGAFVQNLKPDQQFDTILYVDVLEHIEDDASELIAACKHLVHGGMLIVLSPAHISLFSEFDCSIGHFRRYNRTSLAALTPPGCRVESVSYLDSVGMAISMANRLFLKQSTPSLRQILFWDRFLLPISRFLDRLMGFCFGRSIVYIWKNETNVETKT